MKLETLIGIGLFTFALVLTVYSWTEYLQSSRVKEGFSGSGPDIVSDIMLRQISDANDPSPTKEEADQAYQTLLRFIRDDFSLGIKYVKDFRDKFYGDTPEFRKDLDIRTLLENYRTPLQRL